MPMAERKLTPLAARQTCNSPGRDADIVYLTIKSIGGFFDDFSSVILDARIRPRSSF